jgi:hypothetical protein
MDRNLWASRLWLHRQAGRLTPQDVITGRALLKRANGSCRCWPSEARIASDAACSARSVRRTKAKLRDMEMLGWRAPRRPDGRQSVCSYVLSVPMSPVSPPADRPSRRTQDKESNIRGAAILANDPPPQQRIERQPMPLSALQASQARALKAWEARRRDLTQQTPPSNRS